MHVYSYGNYDNDINVVAWDFHAQIKNSERFHQTNTQRNNCCAHYSAPFS